MGGQFSRSHADGPNHFVLQDMQRAEETEMGRLDPGLDGGLGYFQSNVFLIILNSIDYLSRPHISIRQKLVYYLDSQCILKFVNHKLD